jgi:hypothetical protein
MRRQRESRIHEPERVDEVYCDITALLVNDQKGRGKATVDEVPDMVLSESDEEEEVVVEEEEEEEEEEEDIDDVFELVESRGVSEHNGTVRRWYRGFRH